MTGEIIMWYPLMKRVIDLIGAVGGLLVMCLLYPLLSVAIRLNSPGPVIFSQERMGRDCRVFWIYKFRTMRFDVTGCGPKPDAEDDRVTTVGRFLRRTSLDELPQFWNVLRGEMSLVGPRPEQLAFIGRYNDWKRQRFIVKPGLTGWWQVNGRLQPLYDHVEYDIYYVEHRSLRLDLLILLRTARAVLSGEGAC
jgi:lipopolysaccharide/colanic/teichoic acid biosynthesis glycosyltransferase